MHKSKCTIPKRIACKLAWIGAALMVATTSFASDTMTGGHHHLAAGAKPPPPFVASRAKPFSGLMDDSMSVMNYGMSSAQMSGDADHDFAAMMIPHHQGAVDMAKAELLYGKNPILRRLAQEIIVTQGSEIAVMQSELKKYSSSHSENR